jgi:hypothetical protein
MGVGMAAALDRVAHLCRSVGRFSPGAAAPRDGILDTFLGGLKGSYDFVESAHFSKPR